MLRFNHMSNICINVWGIWSYKNKINPEALNQFAKTIKK